MERLYLLRRDRDFRTFLRYAVIGVTQNAAFYGLTLVLLHLNFSAWQAILLLYPLAITASFIANRRWSFGDRMGNPHQFWKYVLVYVIAYPCTVMLAWLGEAIGFPPWLSSLMTLIIAVIGVFLALKFFVFRGSAANDLTSPL